METSFIEQKCKTQVKTFSDDEKKRRTRDSLILCLNHLITLGYFSSAQQLAQEAGIGNDRFELCDNMNFLRVLVDFENSYEQKYKIKPKITKIIPKGKKKTYQGHLSNIYNIETGIQMGQNNVPKNSNSSKNNKKQISDPKSSRIDSEETKNPQIDLSINATPIVPQVITKKKKSSDIQNEIENNILVPPEVKLLDPVPPQLRLDYGDLTNVIARDIFIEKTGVHWDDIVGLSNAKRILREAVVMPLKFPNLFKDKKLLTPWKGVLLHGPPGTGKTLLAKAVASEGTTFFNISASTIISKWRGDSEKLIRILFELARFHAPSTVFIDELDSIMTKRSTSGEHEASRRMKTEMLTQMDGLIQSKALVFVLAASNFPFDLDPALLRRLEKRILVPLPEYKSRINMFKTLLTPDISQIDLNFESFAQRTDNFSGSDIKLICKEASMEPLRRLMSSLHEKYGDKYLDIVQSDEMILDLITNNDVEKALERTKSSTFYKMEEYEKWQEKFGVS